MTLCKNGCQYLAKQTTILLCHNPNGAQLIESLILLQVSQVVAVSQMGTGIKAEAG